MRTIWRYDLPPPPPDPVPHSLGEVPKPRIDAGKPEQNRERDDLHHHQPSGSQTNTRQSSTIEAVLRSVEVPIVTPVLPILTNLNSGTDMPAATTPYKVVAKSPCSKVMVEEFSTEGPPRHLKFETCTKQKTKAHQKSKTSKSKTSGPRPACLGPTSPPP